jgi:putative transcriptional regulator
MSENFKISVQIFRGTCYDILAKRDQDFYIIKVFLNVDTIKIEIAEELKLLSTFLGAKPLVIGVRSGTGKLEDSVIYSRHGLPILSFATFYEYVKEIVYPISFAAPGGFYVKINNRLLREIREKKDISLGELARIGRVSRRTILMYEEGESATSIDVVLKLEEYFKVPLIEDLNPFRYHEKPKDINRFIAPDNEFEEEVSNIFDIVGSRIYFTKHSKIDAITTYLNDIYLTGLIVKKEDFKIKSEDLAQISKIVEKESFLISRFKDESFFKGLVPVVSLKDIRNVKKNINIKEILEEYKL